MANHDAAQGQDDGRVPYLEGVRVLAVEQFGAGPFATLYLAQLGAEVVKVEDPRSRGDVGRYVPPGQTGTDSLYFETFNRGKKSVVLDLQSEAGRMAFQKLVVESDVVFNNLRGDLPARLGLTYEALSPANARIVCVSLSGYGRTTEQARRPGYDALIQAEVGWAAITGEPDGPPTKSGLSLVDYVGGLTAAIATLAGVLRARISGVGGDLDVNLYDAALAMWTYPATWYLSAGEEPRRYGQSSHPSIVPFQFFQTADGYVAVACPKEKFWVHLAKLVGIETLESDERYRDFAGRREHREELVMSLQTAFLTRTTSDWINRLSDTVPVAPVNSASIALNRDLLIGREMLVHYEHPTLGAVETIGLPIQSEILRDGRRTRMTRAPRLGEHTVEVLQAAGVTAEDAASVLSHATDSEPDP
jgi:crotonobetainyl-CoA:carnitine CoA-transferase CaiB-like acyl-CoA transferase